MSLRLESFLIYSYCSGLMLIEQAFILICKADKFAKPPKPIYLILCLQYTYDNFNTNSNPLKYKFYHHL